MWDFRFSRRRVWSLESSTMDRLPSAIGPLPHLSLPIPHWSAQSTWTPTYSAMFSRKAHSSPWWWRQHVPLKHRSTSTWRHGSTSQKTLKFIVKIWLPIRTINGNFYVTIDNFFWKCNNAVRSTSVYFTSSFPYPFVPLQRRGCLVAPLFLWIVLVPCAGD
jgi:hypothetical protein